MSAPDGAPMPSAENDARGCLGCLVDERDHTCGFVAINEPRTTWNTYVIPPVVGDPNHPESVDCDGYPLSGSERCGRSEHRPYEPPKAGSL